MVKVFLLIVLVELIAGHWYWRRTHTVFRLGQRVKLVFSVRQVGSKLYFRNVTIPVPADAELGYGDIVTTIGTITWNNRFDLVLQPESFEVVPGSNSLGKQLYSWRQTWIGELKRYLPPEEAGLAAGMLFGGTQDMTRAQILAYRRVGLAHLVAASGYNVTLVAGWAIWAGRRLLGRNLTMPFVVLVIVLYCIMAGGTASVVRAGVMSVIVALGLVFGRETSIRWVLLLTVLVMLVFNPDYLIDVGFQLSVAATAGLVLFAPKSVWWTTIAAQIATIPLILHHFGNLSLIAPVANILVAWVVPPIMQITALAVVSGGILSLMAWPLLKFANILTFALANWQYANLTVAPVAWTWVLGYYLVLILICKRLKLV